MPVASRPLRARVTVTPPLLDLRLDIRRHKIGDRFKITLRRLLPTMPKLRRITSSGSISTRSASVPLCGVRIRLIPVGTARAEVRAGSRLLPIAGA